MKYEEMKSSELVGLYNERAEKLGWVDDKISLPWKSKKTDLIARIDALEARGRKTVKAFAVDLLCEVLYYENYREKPSEENRVPPDHEHARSVGLPYSEILRRIREEFPNAETSEQCLRWYAAHVNVESQGFEGRRLCQRRIRSSWKKEKKK